MTNRIAIAGALLVVGLSPIMARDPAGVVVDKEKRTVTIDAKIAPRKLPNLDQVYPIEVVACWPHPKGEKAHETMVVIEANPSDVHKALESLGLKAGAPADVPNNKPATGPELSLYLEFSGRKVPVSQLLVDNKTGKSLPKSVRFRFTGSELVQPDPNKPDKVYGADKSGTLVSVFPVTAKTVLQSSLSMADEKFVKLDVNKSQLPPEGTPVKLVIEVGKS
jgi:hypothetical protein